MHCHNVLQCTLVKVITISIIYIYSTPHLLLGSLLLLHHHGCSLLNHLQLIIVRHAWGRHARRLHAHVHAGRRGPSRHHAHGWDHAHTRRHVRHGHGGHVRHPWHLEPRRRRTSSHAIITLACLSMKLHFS